MGKFLSSKLFSICLNVICFSLTVAGLFATHFMLAIPIFVISLPVAIFSKSEQLKGILMSCLLAFLALFLAFWVQYIF